MPLFKKKSNGDAEDGKELRVEETSSAPDAGEQAAGDSADDSADAGTADVQEPETTGDDGQEPAGEAEEPSRKGKRKQAKPGKGDGKPKKKHPVLKGIGITLLILLITVGTLGVGCYVLWLDFPPFTTIRDLLPFFKEEEEPIKDLRRKIPDLVLFDDGSVGESEASSYAGDLYSFNDITHGLIYDTLYLNGSLLNDTVSAAHELAGFGYRKLEFDPGRGVPDTYITASAENGDHLFDIYNTTADYIAVSIDGRKTEYYEPVIKVPYGWTSGHAPVRFQAGKIPSNSTLVASVPSVRSFRETLESLGVTNFSDEGVPAEVVKAENDSRTPGTGVWSVAKVSGVQDAASVLNWLSTMGFAESEYEKPSGSDIVVNSFEDKDGKELFSISWDSDKVSGNDDYVWITVDGKEHCYNLYVTGETDMSQSLLETYSSERLLNGSENSYWFNDVDWIHLDPR
jgi:hypothetical protein